MYEVVRLVLTPYLLLFYRARCIDSDNVPADGPAIIAPNHFSFLDHFFVAVYLRRKVHFMAKSQLFKRPMQVVYTQRRRVPGAPRPPRRGGVQDRPRDPRARRHRSSCTSRAAARAPASSASRATASAGWRSSPARRSCRPRSPAPSGRATGSASSSRRSRSSSASRSSSSRSRSRRKEQAQAASEEIFARIRDLHTHLVGEGRKGAVRRARDARRAANEHAEAAGRRPLDA